VKPSSGVNSNERATRRVYIGYMGATYTRVQMQGGSGGPARWVEQRPEEGWRVRMN
jgi:hypothetical protein